MKPIHALLYLLIVSVLGLGAPLATAASLSTALDAYGKTLVDIGARPDDFLLTRLRREKLPTELLELPAGQEPEAIVVVDMLAFYYLGYRTTSIRVLRDDEVWQSGYVEKYGRSSSWTRSTDETPPSMRNTIAALLAFVPTPASDALKQSRAAQHSVTQYPAERTYNGAEPSVESFAGYVGLVSVIQRGRLVKQMPFTIADFVEPGTGGHSRTPRNGRIIQALQGLTPEAMAAVRDAAAVEDAASKGEIEVLRSRVTDRTQSNAVTSDGWTLLTIAVDAGRIEAAELLLKQGADPNQVNAEGDTPLLLAVNLRDQKLVKTLIQHGAKASSTGNKRAQTALSAAIWSRNIDLLKLVLEAGVDFAAHEQGRDPPLVLAAHMNEPAFVQQAIPLLLKAGASPNGYSKKNRCRTAIDEMRSKNPALAPQFADVLAVDSESQDACRAALGSR